MAKSAYIAENPPNSFVDVLKVADLDFFPNIRKLMLIGETSPISFSEVERAASGIRTLKTAFRNTMKDDLESNLNLLQIHTTGSINLDQILQIFIKKIPSRLFSSSLIFSET